jgi:hypothetical protein
MMRRFCAIVGIALAVVWPAGASEEARLVLVASTASTVAPLSAGEVRKLYLGIPIVQQGHEIVPLRNVTTAPVQELFLQRVLFMSAQAYERNVSARVFKGGENRAVEFRKPEALVEALSANPWAVTYMSSDSATRTPGVRIVSEL